MISPDARQFVTTVRVRAQQNLARTFGNPKTRDEFKHEMFLDFRRRSVGFSNMTHEQFRTVGVLRFFRESQLCYALQFQADSNIDNVASAVAAFLGEDRDVPEQWRSETVIKA